MERGAKRRILYCVHGGLHARRFADRGADYPVIAKIVDR